MKNLKEIIIENFQDENEIITWDGLDDAFLGIQMDETKVIYSYKKCIEILCREMNEEEAIEFFEYNILNNYIGDKTPIICFDNF